MNMSHGMQTVCALCRHVPKNRLEGVAGAGTYIYIYTHTRSQPCDSLVQDAFFVVGSQLDTLGQEHGSLPKVASAVRRDSRLRDSGDFLLAKCSDLQGLGGVG